MKMNDEQLARLSVPEITELIKRLADELELRAMAESEVYDENS